MFHYFKYKKMATSVSNCTSYFRMEDPSTGSPISQPDSSPSKALSSPPPSGSWPRSEADHLKAKSETTLYPDQGRDQSFPTKSVPNLDGIGTPDEQKIRYIWSMNKILYISELALIQKI